MNEIIKIKPGNKKVVNDDTLKLHYNFVRSRTKEICAPLEIEDYCIQTTPEVSPPKWHLAHTAWFFETLVLKPFHRQYKTFHPLYEHIFNSYYDTIGSYHPRPERGLLSRPTVEDVYHYRDHVDHYMSQLIAQFDHPQREEIVARTTLGLNHEQQHQELLLTDIKFNFAYNPLRPAYRPTLLQPHSNVSKLTWISFEEGLAHCGYKGKAFAYDNEKPRHRTFLHAFKLASRPVTNSEYIDFINAGGYQTSEFWLSEAWKQVKTQKWHAPLYWEKREGAWQYMTLAGMKTVDLNAPVSHVSYFEAAAYARWAGKRLPTEYEWEIAAAQTPVKGNFFDRGYLQPVAFPNDAGLTQMFGDVWEWTQSPYISYPGYQQAHGPLGEYNGKFMSSQMVLRGGSCATSISHIRPTYRNFFYPHERWQFSGFRLAEDV